MEHYCTARSKKYFEDPLEFKPERWLRENRGESHAFSILPFGYGVRMCLGKKMDALFVSLFVYWLIVCTCRPVLTSLYWKSFPLIYASLSVSRSLALLVSQSITSSVGRLVRHSVGRLVGQSVISRLVGQSAI